MTAVFQRVLSASVEINGEVFSKCEAGALIFLGIEKGDNNDVADAFSRKISKLRVFRDEDDRMNLSVSDIGGSVLVVSNFTLCADCSHGNRPSFPAESSDIARPIYERFVKTLGAIIGPDKVGCGQFGADMKVSAVNDGPVTLIIKSNEVLGSKFCRGNGI